MAFSFGAPAPGAAPAFGAAPAAGGAKPAFGAPAPAPAFGAAPAPAAGGLFGSTPAPAPAAGGLFGSTPAPAPATGGLFGSTAPAPATGGLFGSTTAPAPATGGLFGAAPAPAPAFGAPAPATGGLFGAAPAPAFGAPAPATGGLFGAAPAPSTGGHFGAAPAPAFGAPAPSAFGAAPTTAANLAGYMPYSSLPQDQKNNIDTVHQAIMTHKRTILAVSTMAPKQLDTSTQADVAGGELPLPVHVQRITGQVRKLEDQLKSLNSSIVNTKKMYETSTVQAIRDAKWPIEVVAARVGATLENKERNSNAAAAVSPKSQEKRKQEETQRRLKELLDATMVSTDQIYRMPSPYLWQCVEEMEERSRGLQAQLHSLKETLEISNKVTSDEFDVVGVIQLQEQTIWKVASKLTEVHTKVDHLRQLYTLHEKGLNVLEEARLSEENHQRQVDRQVRALMVQNLPSTLPTGAAPAPGGGLFGSTSTGSSLFGAPAPAPGGSLFGLTPAPATGGLFGAAPAPSVGLFGSTPAPAAGGGLFGSAPAPATGGLFGATPAPAPATGGLFGATTPAPAPGGGLFGATPAPAAPAFGATPAPAPTTAFGAAPAAPAFGATPAPAAPAFGAAPAAPNLFGTSTATTPTAKNKTRRNSRRR